MMDVDCAGTNKSDVFLKYGFLFSPGFLFFISVLSLLSFCFLYSLIFLFVKVH